VSRQLQQQNESNIYLQTYYNNNNYKPSCITNKVVTLECYVTLLPAKCSASHQLNMFSCLQLLNQILVGLLVLRASTSPLVVPETHSPSSVLTMDQNMTVSENWTFVTTVSIEPQYVFYITTVTAISFTVLRTRRQRSESRWSSLRFPTSPATVFTRCNWPTLNLTNV